MARSVMELGAIALDREGKERQSKREREREIDRETDREHDMDRERERERAISRERERENEICRESHAAVALDSHCPHRAYKDEQGGIAE